MFATPSPKALLRHQADVLSSQMSGVRDARPESIHDARIATRRIRELLRVMEVDRSQHLVDEVRRLGKALGRVRELDVMVERLRETAAGIPIVTPAAASVEVRLRQVQIVAREKMIRQLDEIDVPDVLDHMGRLAGRRWVPEVRHRWAQPLRAHLAQRAKAVERKVGALSGVYFANRAHATRIAVKKLRYAAEVAQQAGLWQRRRLLKELRRVQESLGTPHDLQVLLDEMERLPPTDRNVPHVDTLIEVIDASVRQGYQAFLQQRERLTAICRICQNENRSRLSRLIRRAA